MEIVEIGDCSMVIMKDSNDPPWVSVGDTYRKAVKKDKQIVVCRHGQTTFRRASDCIYTAGRLVLLFKDSINAHFNLHDKVDIFVAL